MTKNNGISSATFFNSRLTSTISISLVLFLLGLIILLALLADNLSIYVKENLSFSIVLSDNMKAADILNLQKRLDTSPFVKSTEFISKEQASKELQEEIGENPEIFLGFNPLLSSIDVKLKSAYANNDSIVVIEKKLKSESNIRDVLYRKDMLQIVNDNIKKIGVMLLILAVILMTISFALINNTIKLTIYSKRFLIYTMKLVGATGAFIRKPFLWKNIVSGIVAAILSISMLSILLFYLSKEMDNLFVFLNLNILLTVFALVILLGILISAVATYFSVNKFLRMRGDSLYNI